MSKDYSSQTLCAITLDPVSLGAGTPDQEHERRVAIYDLLDSNVFSIPDHESGPYHLNLSLRENKLIFDIRTQEALPIMIHILSLSPFRRFLRDYFLMCESYFQAIRTATPAQIEAIDMGRRGLHDEGAQILLERLKGKIICDFDTARRLFTLITALHWKG